MFTKNLLKEIRLTVFGLESSFDKTKRLFQSTKKIIPRKGQVKEILLNLKTNPFPAFLLIISLFVCFTNYVPGTWLSGWDTLHPEFNFGLYFKRIFFGVWQEHQGLGAAAAQAHASELPRFFLYWLSSFVFSLSFLRYSYFFLTLILGPLGVYFFLSRLVFKNLPQLERGAFSFSGALVYLLNLAVLQHYYVPLEMFATHFATLGWLLLFATRFLEEGRKKYFVLFSIVTIFATSIAHTPTLFYAYFLGLSLYIITLSLTSFKESIKKALFLLVTTLVLNSFWLLPNIYFVFDNGQEVINSKIHTQFSDKAFLTGKKFGTFADTALLKNFLFDWGEYSKQKGQFVDLFDEWFPHLQKPFVMGIGYLVFLFVLAGIFLSLKSFLQKRGKYGIALFPVFLVSFFLIANDNFLSNSIYSFLVDDSAILKESLRFPFTKFSILLIFTYAIFFAIAVSRISLFLVKKLGSLKIISLIQAFVVFLALSFYMVPALGGNLISPSMKVKIPDSYFQMFAWFNSQEDQGRIAPFPVDTFWGWTYQKWGYEGAGFRWFGLQQPILDREFDRWSPYNENYYWEISYALYSKNKDLLEKVLNKYQVHWLLVNKSITNPSSPKSLYFDELKELINRSNKITLAQTFGEVEVYRVSEVDNNFVWLESGLPSVEPTYKWNNYDKTYTDNGDYISPSGNWKLEIGNSTYYPFRSLFTGKSQKDLEFKVEDKGDYFLFSNTVPKQFSGYPLKAPEDKGELNHVDPNNYSKVEHFTPEVTQNGDKIEVKVPKIDGLWGADFYPAENYSSIQKTFNTNIANCNKANFGDVKNQIILEENKKLLRLISQDANNCSASFWLPSLPHKYAYLISVTSRNNQGQSPVFWVENLTSHKADIESFLPQNKDLAMSYFVQPPMEEDGLGYTLHIDNISIGREKSANDFESISIHPIPYKFLTGLTFTRQETVGEKALSEVNVWHPNPSYYEVQTTGSGTLVLSQGYDKGWVAYSLNPLPVPLEHVLVNNWENGWELGSISGKKVIIIFLPQFLEYLGFALAGAFIIFVIRKRYA